MLRFPSPTAVLLCRKFLTTIEYMNGAAAAAAVPLIMTHIINNSVNANQYKHTVALRVLLVLCVGDARVRVSWGAVFFVVARNNGVHAK